MYTLIVHTGSSLSARAVCAAPRLARRFSDWRIRALFTFQDLYVGLSPTSAPGVFSLLAATELTDGVWYPLGGFRKVNTRAGVGFRSGVGFKALGLGA